MPGPTIASSSQALDSSLPTIYSEFMLLNDVSGVARKCATEYRLLPHEGSTKNVNNYGRVLALGLSDGVDYGQAQTLSDTATSYTPSEIGVLTILSGRTMSRVQDPALLRRTARILNRAYDLKLDTDGVNQLASFSSTAIGSAGTVAAPGHFLASSGRLGIGSNRSNPEPAPEPWYTIMHDLSLVPVAGRIIPFGTTPSGSTAYDGTNGTSVATGRDEGLSNDILREGIKPLGRLGRSTVYADANLIPDANDDVTGAMFSKEGLVFVNEVEATMDYDMPKRLRGGAEVMVFGSYVFGNYRAAAFGVPLTFDASNPTG